MEKGFTLIDLIVTIAIIAVLSSIVLFSVTQYINKGKDTNVSGNLSVLVPAGEVFYNMNNTYSNFCTSNSLKNAYSQMSVPVEKNTCSTGTYAGLCCNVASDGNSWVACAQMFTDVSKAYCVDSRGVKKQISVGSCDNDLTSCDDTDD